MASDRPPQTYEEWRHCIEVKCGIPLTQAYCEERIDALADPADRHTARFTELYGEPFREQVAEWFARRLDEAGVPVDA